MGSGLFLGSLWSLRFRVVVYYTRCVVPIVLQWGQDRQDCFGAYRIFEECLYHFVEVCMFFWGFWGSGLFWGSLRSLRFKVVVLYIFGVLMSRSFCSGVRIVRIALVSIGYLRFRFVVYYIWCVDVPIVLQCQDSGLLWCV